MRVQIDIGDYGGPSLDDWINQVNTQLLCIQSAIYRINATLNAIKKIVPLVDEDLGNYDATSAS